MKNIVLTGFMATGKTKISRVLADSLGYNCIDTDDLIVERMGMSINDIFEQYGEAYFRKIEKEVIKEISSVSDTVIATGGGVVLDSENISELRKNGIVFNLSPNFSVIEERLDRGGRAKRPLVREQSMDEIYKRFLDRRRYYDNCDYKINVTNEKTPAENSQYILEIYERYRTNGNVSD